MAVELCGTERASSPGPCAGPPATLPVGHDTTADVPLHLGTCGMCLGTLLQCWRSGCTLAGDPIGEHYDDLVARRTRSLAARLWPSVAEEARQDITLDWIRRLRRNPSAAPEVVAELRNPDAWATKAIGHLYINWYNANVRGKPVMVDIFDNDEESDPVASSRHFDDPAEVVPDALAHELLSDDGEKRVRETLDLFREQLVGMEDGPYFAGWMQYAFAEEDAGRTPSKAAYSRLMGVPKATGDRRINRTMRELRSAVGKSAQYDGEDRDFTLNFLHRLLRIADPTMEDGPTDPHESSR